MTQVQASQSQQAELLILNTSKITQQVTQLMRRNNQAPVTPEQLIQNNINIAQ